jgi:SAM-dependent methyltransferase
MFSKRLIKPELLDHAPPEEARPNLADLVRINSNFGGHATIAKMMEQVASERDTFTLLDIGAASGDIARVLQRLYPSAFITNLDYSPVNLESAPHQKVIADAFALPFRPESFDYVLCSLFLHHFNDEQVAGLLRSFYCIARRALLVCDLERHIISYCFLPVTKWFFGWQRITIHDGPVSVRAGFRSNELLALSKRAGITDAQVSVHRPAFRLSLIAMKDQDREWRRTGGHSEEDAHRGRTAAFRIRAPNR